MYLIWTVDAEAGKLRRAKEKHALGKRSGTQTVIRIMAAFREHRTWRQSDLARRVGVSTESLRRRLCEMLDEGAPLERQEDPPHVYWSVPPHWFPAGIVLPADDAEELLRQLARAPRSKRRDELMARIVESARGKRAHLAVPAVVPPLATEAEESVLPVVEDAASRRTALAMRYYSASRGVVELRHVSVHRVMSVRPPRFLAVCHRSRSLKWFRVDNVMRAYLDGSVPFLEADGGEVDRMVSESLDGFHQGLEAEEHQFRVRDPEARWVARNLLEGMVSEPAAGGIVVRVKTSAPLRVARFVVGLGGAATAETGMLRGMVEELARGALGNRCSATNKQGRR